ncbi:DUF2202 domain-containing protein [Anaerolinea thermophila]|uniref:DUF2202 domain-containing protein n=2 Tax=Anaerolinea TaxID=233189 RepID=UPI0026EE076C|nr:DUF2202 domain-containing protein [Anaerolinea thermophila]
MFKKIWVLLTFSVAMLAGCAPVLSASAMPVVQQSVEEVSQAEEVASQTPVEIPANVPAVTPKATVSGVSDSLLTSAEQEALLYMREEEKLAHDVYITLYSLWQLPLFNNIASSEQTHTQMVKSLLDRYGIADPASAEVGVFTNADLQQLYDTLIEQGSQSLGDALKVGALIEEVDIQDLDQALATVQQADIRLAFENLKAGSENHLRAFTSTLQQQTGEVYQPQVLSAETVNAILNSASTNGMSDMGNGRGYRGGRP